MIGPIILPDEAGNLHEDLLSILVDGRALVPANWRLEVLNLGRMAVRKRRLLAKELRYALNRLSEFRVTIDGNTNAQAWGRIAELAETHDLTAYDAAYLELSLRKALPLMTRDASLRRAAVAASVGLL